MKLYNERLKTFESIIDVKSRFFDDNGLLKVKIQRAEKTTFSDAFSSQLKKDFSRLFFLDNEEQSSILLTFEQFEDIYHLSENYDTIIYWILLAMWENKLMPDTREESDFRPVKLKYNKKQFVDMLKKFPELFVDKYKTIFYSSLVDAIETTIKYCKQYSLHKFCYQATLIGKEYLDDFVAFLEKRENVGYPRKNKAINQDIYFAKCENIVERAKTFEI